VNPAWLPLLERLALEGENRTALEPIFANPALVPDPTIMGRKIRALYRSRFLPKPEPRPAPGGKPLTIYDTWLTPEWVEKIAAFKRANAAVLAEAEQKYGVSASLLTAVFLVETHLGAFLGQRPALAALANLAASTDPAAAFPFVAEYQPTREQLDWLAGRQAERAAWALRQLRFFLEYCRRNGFDPVSLPGSLYGAFGLCQFAPGNALKIGVDGNGDGRVDLFDVADAAHSVAAFLKSRGWRENLSQQAKVKVIRQYNNDLLYAQTVLAVAKRI
jgi:membrane-bound lytic murein transglycosylase B